MAFFKLVIEADTDWCETIITDTAQWTVVGGKLEINAPGTMAAFQMSTKLIGIGKVRPWDTHRMTISVFVDTTESVLSIDSRKGAAGPVRYTSFLPNGRQVDYAVNDTNRDPLKIRIALTPTKRAELEKEAEKAAATFDPTKEVAEERTIKPSDE